MGHVYKPGDKVVRVSHPAPRFRLGQVYTVRDVVRWDGEQRLRVRGEDGHTVSSKPCLYEPFNEGATMNPVDYPSTPVFNMNVAYTPDELRKFAEDREAADAALKAEEAAKQAVHSQLTAHVELAKATLSLLAMVSDLFIGKQAVPLHRADVAKYRKALAPLAESYGVEIVLLGDKTSATIVKG